jgi:hypothetical protein
MTCRVIPARRKGHCRQGQGKGKAVPKTQKGWMFKKRRRAKPEGITEIWNEGSREQLCLRKERTEQKTEATSVKQNYQQDLQEVRRAGDRKANSLGFQ